MFTRARCSLCEKAWEVLRKEQQSFGFRLEAVDIDKDPKLVKLHGEWVPVVAVNGKVRFRGPLNRVLLRRFLRAEANRAPKQ